MTILITGAGGKTGQTIITYLAQQSQSVRAWLRTARPLPQDVTMFIGDMRQPEAWRRALAGVRKVYHICPNMHPAEVEIGKLAIEAAGRADVDMFVYHSVLYPQTERMPHHWHKLRVEEQLIASGLPFTILQPAAYMQNIRQQWPQIVATGVYTVPYPAATRLSLVDLHDVAAVAAKMLLQSDHDGATYQLVGDRAMTQNEVAAILAAVAGRPVRVEAMTPDVWRQRNAALNDYAKETLHSMFSYYAAYGLIGSRNILTWLLGRSPTGLRDVALRWRQKGVESP